MEKIADQLELLIDKHVNQLKSIPAELLEARAKPGKWSKKEMIGHMIDSAHNNIRRFIVAQYEETPLIIYDQDKWVAIANYQYWNVSQLIELWYLLNKQLCRILGNTAPAMGQRNCQTQELHSLDWLADDYVKHLQHHLHQVLDLEPVAYP